MLPSPHSGGFEGRHLGSALPAEAESHGVRRVVRTHIGIYGVLCAWQ